MAPVSRLEEKSRVASRISRPREGEREPAREVEERLSATTAESRSQATPVQEQYSWLSEFQSWITRRGSSVNEFFTSKRTST